MIGCERARAAEEDCVDREGDLAVLGEIDLNALRDQRVGIWIADLDDLKAAGEGERLRIGKRRSGEIVKADYVQSATGARLDDKGFILHILVEEGIVSKENVLEAIFGVVELGARERPSSRLKRVPTTWSSTSMLKICGIRAAALAGFLISAPVIEAQKPTIQRGRAFAQANCARCHAIGRSGESPLPKAPLFEPFMSGIPSRIWRSRSPRVSGPAIRLCPNSCWTRITSAT